MPESAHNVNKFFQKKIKKFFPLRFPLHRSRPAHFFGCAVLDHAVLCILLCTVFPVCACFCRLAFDVRRENVKRESYIRK